MNYFDRMDQAENDVLILRILNESKIISNMLDDVNEALDETDADLMKGKIMQSVGGCSLSADEIMADVWELIYKIQIPLSQDIKDELFKFQRMD